MHVLPSLMEMKKSAGSSGTGRPEQHGYSPELLDESLQCQILHLISRSEVFNCWSVFWSSLTGELVCIHACICSVHVHVHVYTRSSQEMNDPIQARSFECLICSRTVSEG